jgi:putative Holliday junction resolvase
MQGSFLAIDYGTAKCGLAHTVAGIAMPWKNLPTQEIKAFVQSLVEELEIAGIVIGLPLHMNGQESDMSRKARNFAQDLHRRIPTTPIYLIDERLSSYEAKLASSLLSHSKPTDAIAAHIILEIFLSNL